MSPQSSRENWRSSRNGNPPANGMRFNRLSWEFLEDRRLLAAMPEFLGDLGRALPIKPGNEFAEVGGTVYFTGQISTVGDVELWRTDGTLAGTNPVRDLNVSEGSKVSNLTNLNGTLFFLGDNQRAMRGLFRSDGTAAGTELIKQLGLPSTNIARAMVSAGGKLFFVGRDSGSLTDALWVSDGTPVGTVKLATLGSGLTTRFGLVAAGDAVFFESNNDELWISDGTAAGTKLLRKFSSLGLPVSIGQSVYFSAEVSGGATGTELWKSNGTAAGTVQVKDIRPGTASSSPQSLLAAGGLLYFSASDGANGAELWRSDGSEVGTALVVDLNPGASSSLPRPVAELDGSIYFTAQADGLNRTFWATDGTAAGTTQISEQTFGNQQAPLNGVLFALDSSGKLWRHDPQIGTPELMLAGPFETLRLAGDKLYLRQGVDLVISDGTIEGTIVMSAANHRLSSSNVSDFVSFQGRTYFAAADDAGTELWRDDGVGGIVRVADLNPGPSGSYPRHLRVLGGALYFFANDQSTERHLWRIDEAEGLPQLAVDRTGQGRDVEQVVVADDLMYFGMWNDGSHKLWRTDGTQEGTINLAPNVSALVHAGDSLFFTSGSTLWASDGTVEGTVMLKDVKAGSQTAWIEYLRAFDNRAYFIGREDIYGTELWTSDGTTEGTHPVVDFTPGAGGSSLFPMLTSNVLFLSGTANGTTGLWRLTESGETIEIVKPLGVSSSPYGELDGILYFQASGTDGDGLWRSDGTETGTWFVAPIGELSTLTTIVAAGRWLYFAADDGTHGMEVWRTDGTTGGTQLVVDLWPGILGSDPRLFATSSGDMYFGAYNGITGFDPWVIRAPQVIGRHLFYNNSAFDGENAAAEAADDGAIATDKVAYLPGSGLSTTASVSSYSRGINGVMIDIAGLDGELTADDFTFRMGTSNSPESWTLAPAPLEVVVRAGEGAGGSDRVTITWADGAITNTWLQVIVEGNDAAGGFNTNTGLAESDVFFFGSRVGDTFVGTTPMATVTGAFDELGARFNPGFNQPVTNIFDFNRDGVVNSADQLIARNNTGVLVMLDIDALVEVALADAFDAGTLAAGQLTPAIALTSTSGRAALAFALATDSLDEDAADQLIPGRPRRTSR